MEEAGWMELDEFHIRDDCPGPPGHGHAVTRRHVRICGLEIHAAQAAGRQQDRACRDRMALAGILVVDHGARNGALVHQ